MSRAYRVLEGGGTPGPLGLPSAGRVHGQRVGPVAWSTPPPTPWSVSPAPLSCGRQRTLAPRPACRGSSPAHALPQTRAARQKPDASAATSTLTGPLSALYQGAWPSWMAARRVGPGELQRDRTERARSEKGLCRSDAPPEGAP